MQVKAKIHTKISVGTDVNIRASRILFVVLLMLAGGVTSCKKEKNGNVPYKPCPCKNKPASNSFSRGEAYLFRDSVPRQIIFDIDPAVSGIIYYSETGEAYIGFRGFSVTDALLHTGFICNFPDFAKEWDIPENGLKIYFEGQAYTACNPGGGIATIVWYDYMLTKLVKR